jgi:hypothetical protein
MRILHLVNVQMQEDDSLISSLLFQDKAVQTSELP